MTACPATAGNGTMGALRVDAPGAVDRLHARALSLRDANEGAPGLRGASFHAGYVYDLDGNTLTICGDGAPAG